MNDMQQMSSPQSQPANSQILMRGLVILLAVLLGAIFLGVAFFGSGGVDQFTAGTPSDEVGVSNQPVEGLLVLSLAAPAPSPELFAAVFPFIYDMARSELSYVFADQLDGEQRAFTEQYRLSPNSNWATFVGQGTADARSTVLRPQQVYQADLAGIKDFPTLVTTLRAGKVVSDESSVKRAPVISDTGDILYMNVPADLSFSDSPDVWGITYVPLNGKSRMLVSGTYPQWVDANRFIFLKSDGLYLLSIDTGYAQKLWGTEGSISSNSMLDLSDDKTTIAWSTPADGTVTLLRVLDWSTPTITLRGTIPVAGLWPTIAPDSSALAIMTPEATPGSLDGWHVAFYSLDTLQPIAGQLVPLNNAEPWHTSLTDWRH